MGVFKSSASHEEVMSRGSLKSHIEEKQEGT